MTLVFAWARVGCPAQVSLSSFVLGITSGHLESGSGEQGECWSRYNWVTDMSLGVTAVSPPDIASTTPCVPSPPCLCALASLRLGLAGLRARLQCRGVLGRSHQRGAILLGQSARVETPWGA